MEIGIIDIGSNSVRLSVYQVGDPSIQGETSDTKRFSRLFGTKVMAGLAAYVDARGVLSDTGIERACDALFQLKAVVDAFGVEELRVFATASIRNVTNFEEVLAKVMHRTGIGVEIVDAAEEALLGFHALAFERPLDKGVVVDIGGGSSEVLAFCDGAPLAMASLPIGSLGLYRRHVGNILPTEKEIQAMRERVSRLIGEQAHTHACDKGQGRDTLYAIGGTARAFAKLANHHYGFARTNDRFKRGQLNELVKYLGKGKRKSRELPLGTCPERIHTALPGLLILQALVEAVEADNIVVSEASVREGYLLSRVLPLPQQAAETQCDEEAMR